MNAKSTFVIGTVSLPLTCQACAYTDISWPRSTTWDGASRVTKTLSLLSVGKAQPAPVRAAAKVTMGVARTIPRIQSAVEQIGADAGPSVQPIGHARLRRDVLELAVAAIQEDARALVARQAGAADRGPIPRVLEDVALCAGDLGHRVPVALRRVAGDEAVGDDEIEQAVVVQVAELRAPRPARIRDGA